MATFTDGIGELASWLHFCFPVKAMVESSKKTIHQGTLRYWKQLAVLLLISFGFLGPSLAGDSYCKDAFHGPFRWTSESAVRSLFADPSLSYMTRFRAGQSIARIPIRITKNVAAQPQTLEAIRFLLHDRTADRTAFEFRKRLFQTVAESFTADEALQILKPFARALDAVLPEDLYFANAAIKKMGERVGSMPERFAAMRTDMSDILLHEPIRSIENLGGGWNTALLVTFTNGNRAVFKPFFGQNNLGLPKDWQDHLAFTREVSATSAVEKYLGNFHSRVSGKSPVVLPETQEVALTFAGVSYGLGSIQAFQEGFVSAADLAAKDPTAWKILRKTSKWREAEARIRIIDFILGNPDRLENIGYSEAHFAKANLGNILIQFTPSGEFKIALIDNALGRPAAVDFSTRYLPLPSEIPEDLKLAAQKFDAAEFRSEMQSVLPTSGISDFIKRIQILQNYTLDKGYEK